MWESKSDSMFFGMTFVAFFFYIIAGGLFYFGSSWLMETFAIEGQVPPTIVAIAAMFAVNTGLNNHFG